MRIGYLISQYPAINHTFILREILHLRKSGFDVRAVSVRKPDPPRTAEEADEARRCPAILGLNALSICGILLSQFLRRPVGFLRGLASTRHPGYFAEAVIAGHWFMQDGVTHVHSHFSSTVAWLMVKIFPLTMSMTIHGPAEFEDPEFRLPEKIAAARFVVAISSFGASQMMLRTPALEWKKIETVRLGVDTDIFVPTPHEPGLTLNLLTVGRLAAVKGQHVMIEAVKVLRDRGLAVQLRLAGNGPERRSLEEQARDIADSVSFEGWVGQDEIRDLYKQADVYVMSSMAEGIPVVLMEAMAMEIPCVSTWVNGVPELIDDGVSGLLCPPDDVYALAAAIEKLARDPNLRTTLGKAGRTRVKEKFELATNTEALAQVFRQRLGIN